MPDNNYNSNINSNPQSNIQNHPVRQGFNPNIQVAPTIINTDQSRQSFTQNQQPNSNFEQPNYNPQSR